MSRLRPLSLALLVTVLIVCGILFGCSPSTPPLSTEPDPEPDQPVIVEPEEPEPFEPTVGLYTGRGSWEPDLAAMRNFLAEYELACVEIDRETLNSADLNELCDILVLVGGYSAEYLHYTGDHSRIRSFVEKGGGFVGFCAGAYYASSTMLWQGRPLDYPLKLFPGEAVGPLRIAYSSGTAIDLNEGIPFNLDFDSTIEMRYFDGPSFNLPPGQEVDVLARYSENDEAAVIAFDLGEGRVLLSGPHPELGYSPEGDQINTEGGSGAQWPWLYAALRWLMLDQDRI